VLSRKGLSCFEKNNALVKLYEAEKAKTSQTKIVLKIVKNVE